MIQSTGAQVTQKSSILNLYFHVVEIITTSFIQNAVKAQKIQYGWGNTASGGLPPTNFKRPTLPSLSVIERVQCIKYNFDILLKRSLW